MKKLNVMLLAVAFVISSVATAGTGPVNSEMSLTKEISQLLEKPSFEVGAELEAYVTFTLNENNEIVVMSVDSDSEIVESFIKSRLNYQKVAVQGQSAIKFYKVPVRLIGV